MRKTTLLALAASAPLAFVIFRESAKLLGAVAEHRPVGPSPAVWISGLLIALLLLWTGVLLWNRREGTKRQGMSFEMVAAMAIAEAKKRPAAGSCPRCGRARISEKSPRCLYCGESFTTSAGAPEAPPAGQAKG